MPSEAGNCHCSAQCCISNGLSHKDGFAFKKYWSFCIKKKERKKKKQRKRSTYFLCSTELFFLCMAFQECVGQQKQCTLLHFLNFQLERINQLLSSARGNKFSSLKQQLLQQINSHAKRKHKNLPNVFSCIGKWMHQVLLVKLSAFEDSVEHLRMIPAPCYYLCHTTNS